MESNVENSMEQAVVLHQWKARKLRPVILVWVVLIFLAFMALAHFVVHSSEAVKGLVLAAIGAVGPLVPGLVNRTEYRLTDHGLEKRRFDREKPRDFATVFAWAELDHVRPGRNSFRFAKRLPPGSRARRFWKRHLSDGWTGEFHVEAADRKAVLEILSDRKVPYRGS